MSTPETVRLAEAVHPQLWIGKYLPSPNLSNPFTRIFVRTLDYLIPYLARSPTTVQGRTVAIPSLDGFTSIQTYIARPHTSPAEAELLPCVLWMHGGGLVIGSYQMEYSIIADLALPHSDGLSEGAVVVSPNYRLAPAHPAPIPGDDCLAVWLWVVEHAEELGIDKDRIAIGGDSAGGCMATLLAQRILDHNRSFPTEVPYPKLQLLVYPMLDDRTVSRIEAERSSGYIAQERYPVWSPGSNRYGWKAYLGELGNGPRVEKEKVVPARREDLGGLPPAWIGVGSLDLFHQEDVEYARRLEEAGVEVTLEVVEGGWHGFDGACAGTQVVRDFKASQRRTLREALA